jgi:hypothetical protein
LREEFVEAAKMPSSTAFLMMAGERVDKQGLTSFGRKTFGRHKVWSVQQSLCSEKSVWLIQSFIFSF